MKGAERIRRELSERYEQLISLPFLQEMEAKTDGLAGLFLPTVPDNYLASPKRVMVVGKETRGWNGGLSRVREFAHVRDYIDNAIARYSHFLEKPPRDSKFFQYYNQASAALAGERRPPRATIAWANLFCLSHNKRSPVSSPAFVEIKALSRDVLRAQIELLKPEVILFVTGPSYDKYIKKYFTVTDSCVIQPRSLWQFKADGIPAFRTSHPQWGKGKVWRLRALELALRESRPAAMLCLRDAIVEEKNLARETVLDT